MVCVQEFPITANATMALPARMMSAIKMQAA
jgi:hypothetical protein